METFLVRGLVSKLSREYEALRDTLANFLEIKFEERAAA